MTCNFNLREPKANKPTNLYFVVSINGKQIKLPTGVKIYPEQWNKKKQEAYISFRLSELDNQNNTIVNSKIGAMKKDFLEYKHYLCDNPNKLDSKILLLKQYMCKGNKKKTKDISAITTMKNIIIERNGTDSSKLQYTRNINKFERFLKAKGIEDNFLNMNLKTINSYQKYLSEELGNTPKTIDNIIKGTLFPLLRKADINTDIPFRWHESNLDSFELVKDRSNKELANNKKVALTEEQVIQIHNFTITKESIKDIYKFEVKNKQIEKFQEIKDMFVFQCVVGQ